MSVARSVKSCSKFHDIDQLATADPEQLPALIVSVWSWLKASRVISLKEGSSAYCKSLKASVNMVYLGEKVAADAALSGMTVVLTGKLERLTRSRSKGKIRKSGR